MKVLLAGVLVGQGGIQSHLKWLAKALGEEGVETLVLSLGFINSPAIDHQSLGSFWNSRVRAISYQPNQKSTTIPGLVSTLRLAEIVKIIDHFKPDIYLAVGTGWNLFIPPLLSRTKPRLIFHEVMSGVPSSWKDSRWCVKWWFDDVVGQSPTIAKTFADYFNWRKPITALPALPEPLELTAVLPKVKSRKVEWGTAKAAFFSRLAPHKQAFWLVQQWNLLKDSLAELHIHGTGPEEALIRDYIASQRIGDRVKCFGRYPEGQAYVDLLSSYDLTLLPTIGAEGAPLVLLESMACGVPFVAYGVGGISDYTVENPNVAVVPIQPDVFVSGVRQVAQKLAHHEIEHSQLQQYYLTHYSYNVLKKMWFSYFQALEAQK